MAGDAPARLTPPPFACHTPGVIWEPSREFVEQTNVWRFMKRLGFSGLEDFLAFSRDNPERFWDETMREMGVEWFEPYHQVLDVSRGPEWAQWFVGGRLNIAHNCLDRWAASDRVACIWEGENGATRTITFRELRKDANRVANSLAALGSNPVTAWLCVCPWRRRSCQFSTAVSRPGSRWFPSSRASDRTPLRRA